MIHTSINRQIDKYNEALADVLDDYKLGLSGLTYTYIVDLIADIQSYRQALKAVLRKKFIRDSFQKKSLLLALGKSDAILSDAYDSKALLSINDIAKNYTKVSFEGKLARRALSISAAGYLWNAKNIAGISLSDEYNNQYFDSAENKGLRRYYAQKLIKKYSLSKKELAGLQKLLFKIIVQTVNSSRHKDKNLIQFLEIAIDKELIEFLSDIGLPSSDSLSQLRHLPMLARYNSLCWHCGIQAHYSNQRHYCTARSNEICYRDRTKDREKMVTSLILGTKNKCINCGKYASRENIHSIKGAYFQFCSMRCYNTYRKRIQRRDNYKSSQTMYQILHHVSRCREMAC